MPDKKVSRNGQNRSLTPTQKMEAALSEPGTVNVAESGHDKAKAALVDKFREREQRWRKEQSLHDRQAETESETSHGVDSDTGVVAGQSRPASDRDEDEGGAS